MFENEYRNQMDRVKFSDDFEKRTVDLLKAELQAKPRRRAPRTFVALAACAAALVLAVTLYPHINALNGRARAPAERKEIAALEEVELIDDSMTNSLSRAVIPQEDGNGAAPMAMPDAYVDYEMDECADDDLAYGMWAPAVIAPFETSEFSYIQENRFLNVMETPLSTFAASVDKASFANVKSMLDRGETPPADAVRIEEFVNYFHYDYPRPKAGEPFSVTTELAQCPWNDETMLLMIGIATDPIDTKDIPRSNLVFLIDVSGSMDEPNKLPLCQKAFTMLTEQLRDEDIVSIVTYAGSDCVVLDGASGKDKARILSAIEALSAGGSTAGSRGINTAYEIAWKHFIRGGNNRVILATDGDLNVGVTSEGELTRLIEEKRETGVFLSVMGFGYGNYKDNKLEALAIHGKGNYNYIGDAFEAKRVFVEEMGANLFTVCKDAKLQVEFNPEKVAEYRLIGYENRTMDARDFADDKKDGGQIGAGHQVTAMYELKLVSEGESAESGLKYQAVQTTGSGEYLTVSIRAKKPDSDVSSEYQYPVGEESVRKEMSENMAFAASAVEFGMVLRDSEFKGTSTFQSAADLIKGVDVTEDPYKDDYTYMLRKMAR